MKNFKLTNFLSLIILILFFTNSAFAQQYFPVVAKFTQLPPYPIYLADFSNPNQTNLSIQIQLKDNQIASRPIRLKLYIEGQGFRIESTDLVQGEPAITLALGQIYDLPNTQVANYFKQYNLKVSAEQYSRSFSEGTFRFGIEVIDFATNRPLSGVQWSNPVWIAVNEPPVWVMPANNVSQAVQNPQNVIFQWAPRHKNISDVEYEFTITELFVNENFKGNIQNLFLAQPPYYKVRTRATSLNYNAALPPLLQGRTYAYRVQAIAKRGFEDVGVFRNNGFSEIQHFQNGDKIKPPTQLKAEWTNNDKEIKFNWKGEADHKVFNVQYEEKGTGKWEKLPAQNATFGQLQNNVTIPIIASNKNYQLKVEATNEKGEKAISEAITLESNDLSAFVKVAGVEKDSKEYIIKANSDSTQKAVKKLEPTCDKPDILIDKGSSYSPEAGKELFAGNFKFMFAGDKKGVLQFSIPFAESLKLPVKKINVWAEMDDKAAFNADKQLKEGMIKVTYNPGKLAELKRISDQIPFEELMGKGVGKKLDSVSAKINSYIAKGQVLCKSMLSLNDITANWKVYKNNLDTLNKLYSVKDSLLAAGIKNMKAKVEEKKDDKKAEKKEEKKDEKKSENKEEPKKEDKKEEPKKDEPKKEEKKEEKITQAEKEKIKEQLGALELRLKDTKAERDNVNKLKKYVDETYKELETEIDNVKNTISAVKEEASRLKDLATGAAKDTAKEVSNLAVKDNKDAGSTAKVEATADKAAKAFDPEKIYNAGFLSEYSKKFKNLFEKKPSENAYKILSALFSQFFNGKIGNAKINFK